jgi:uncharacterized repeat protein (TIGR03803 family)
MNAPKTPQLCIAKARLRAKVIAAAWLVLLLAAAAATRAQAQTFTVLHGFAGAPNDGAIPAAGLVMDAEGNLYGTTAFGGLANCSALGEAGCGTVFKLDPSGNETVLHKFSGADGAFPAAGLLMDSAGNLYGTTVNGGSAGFCGNFGCGSVFKLAPSGGFTIFHAFSGSSDGGNPTAGLIMDAAGNLYGTTGFGGDFGIGVVFKLDPTGKETVVHTFTGADGAEPSAPLIMDSAGNLYGTTFRGGAAGFGTIFKLNPATGAFTVLHSFTGGSDGGHLGAGLLMDSAGNLDGTTEIGGTGGAGTVFKLDPITSTLTVLHSFTGGGDGGNVPLEGIPAAGLIMDAPGNLYGATFRGGTGSLGIVFKLDTLNNEFVLHNFTGAGDGSGPLAPLLMDAAGNLYGTASSLMASGLGTVFKLSVQTPQQATQAVINSVNTLFSAGVLNGGQDNSLVTQLEHAITMMNTGKIAGAIGNLGSFISEVNDLLSSDVLSQSQAVPLVNAAQTVIARLS